MQNYRMVTARVAVAVVLMLVAVGAQAEAEQASAVKPAVTNGAAMRMMLVPAGEFMMGSLDTDTLRNSDELLHKVTLTKPFLMSAT